VELTIANVLFVNTCCALYHWRRHIHGVLEEREIIAPAGVRIGIGDHLTRDDAGKDLKGGHRLGAICRTV